MHPLTRNRVLRAATTVTSLGLAGLIAFPLLASPVNPFYGFIGAPALLLAVLAGAGYAHARLRSAAASATATRCKRRPAPLPSPAPRARKRDGAPLARAA